MNLDPFNLPLEDIPLENWDGSVRGEDPAHDKACDDYGHESHWDNLWKRSRYLAQCATAQALAERIVELEEAVSDVVIARDRPSFLKALSELELLALPDGDGGGPLLTPDGDGFAARPTEAQLEAMSPAERHAHGNNLAAEMGMFQLTLRDGEPPELVSARDLVARPS